MEDVFGTLFGIEGCELLNCNEKEEDGKKYFELNVRYIGSEEEICSQCGEKTYKHGSRTINVVDTPFGGKPARMVIQIPRRRCKHCKSIWQPTIKGIDEDHKMTNRAFSNITQKSLEQPFDRLTTDYMLTGNTIKNIFIEFLEANKAKLRFKTPAFLGIDEIKIKHIGEVTVITDLEHRTLFDMLLGRNQQTLTEYFMNMPDRDKVLWVCSDMYRPFEKSIAAALPNARWTIDHFHIVMKANESVDAVRRNVQDDMTRRERINTKRGLAYTLKKRLRDLDTEEAQKIKLLRKHPKYEVLATAFDLKEDFFEIFDRGKYSKDAAEEAFEAWANSIPDDERFDKFRELANTVKHFRVQILQNWDCPISISNGYTECSNRLIREENMKGRGYSFEVLRGRSLYRKTNLDNIAKAGALLGPSFETEEPLIVEGNTEEPTYDEFEDGEDYEPFPPED